MTPERKLELLSGWREVRSCMMQFRRRSGIGGNLFFKSESETERDLMLSFWEHEGDICIAFQNASRALFILRRNGQLYPTKFSRSRPQEEKRKLWQYLCQLKASPLATLAQSGKLTGICCVCGKKLTDPESVVAGIGPICSGKISRVLQPRQASLEEFK